MLQLGECHYAFTDTVLRILKSTNTQNASHLNDNFVKTILYIQGVLV